MIEYSDMTQHTLCFIALSVCTSLEFSECPSVDRHVRVMPSVLALLVSLFLFDLFGFVDESHSVWGDTAVVVSALRFC